jgi:hypothetical protein
MLPPEYPAKYQRDGNSMRRRQQRRFAQKEPRLCKTGATADALIGCAAATCRHEK